MFIATFFVVLALVLHPLGLLLTAALALAALKLKAVGLGFLKVGFAIVLKWLAALFLLFPIFGTTVAYPGYGSHLANGGTAGASYTNLGQLKKFNFNGLKADFDEITNLDSPSIFKEWMKTTVDGSDVSFDGVLNPNDVPTQGLLSNIATSGSAALNYWKITTTDGSTFTFQAYVSDFKFGAEYNKAITFSGSLKIVGNITAVWS